MSLNDAMSSALRKLREQVGSEEDSDRLRELVIEINRLLDAIEKRVAELGGGERIN
jgi:hypothetical protein